MSSRRSRGADERRAARPQRGTSQLENLGRSPPDANGSEEETGGRRRHSRKAAEAGRKRRREVDESDADDAEEEEEEEDDDDEDEEEEEEEDRAAVGMGGATISTASCRLTKLSSSCSWWDSTLSQVFLSSHIATYAR